ncbi:unannotated protein [freshwater metagenome]|uniref:Unannotated protein n=1 Tax=freshwater metagenome TaxID=449393 RepID=A0A6J6GDW4_9ZZZZ
MAFLLILAHLTDLIRLMRLRKLWLNSKRRSSESLPRITACAIGSSLANVSGELQFQSSTARSAGKSQSQKFNYPSNFLMRPVSISSQRELHHLVRLNLGLTQPVQPAAALPSVMPTLWILSSTPLGITCAMSVTRMTRWPLIAKRWIPGYLLTNMSAASLTQSCTFSTLASLPKFSLIWARLDLPSHLLNYSIKAWS